jgi:RHS repeat-associated protein
LQGAGGTGGLLAMMDHEFAGQTYTTFDGNGNVSSYLNWEGIDIAHYEYDPFGRLTWDGASPGWFNIRFATKMQDGNDLYYYGYRFYDPMTGRWINRDPMEEEGGVNLYAMMGNDGVNYWDYLGKCFTKNPDDESTVYVECSAVKRGGVTLGFHCSVVAKCADKPVIRLEDIGPREEHKEHNDRKKRTELNKDYLDKGTGWTRYEVECEEDKCCATYCCLEKGFNDAQFVPYDKTGPNSNTFANALLGKCGCKLKKYVYNNFGLFPFPYYSTGETSTPWGARGWQTDPPDYWPEN